MRAVSFIDLLGRALHRNGLQTAPVMSKGWSAAKILLHEEAYFAAGMGHLGAAGWRVVVAGTVYDVSEDREPAGVGCIAIQ